MRWTQTIFLVTASVVAVCARGADVAPSSKEGLDFFEKNIRPVLVERCYECHSVGKKSKGKLLLDSREGLLKGGETGPAVVPGVVEKSLLISAIRYSHEDLQMPPKDPLTKEQVAAFVRWVSM